MTQKDERALIQLLIANIDEVIALQLNAILHHPEFQALEAGWRGLKMLVDSASKDKKVLVRVLNVSLKELYKDISSAIEFDQSQFYKKVYSNEFDLPGGEPFGILVGNYAFSYRATPEMPDPVGCLEGVSKVAAAAFVPFITAVSPNFFGIDSYHEIPTPFEMEDLLKTPEYQRWRWLQQQEESRYLGLMLPQILMRRPYNADGVMTKHRFFKETTRSHQDYLWGNPAFAFGCIAIKSFADTGWFANIKGLHPEQKTGGVVDLVRDYDATDTFHVLPKISTEYAITDKQEKVFTDIGFMVLKDNPWLKKTILYSVPSLHMARAYSNSAAATTNSKISTMLHYMMCANRFAHYIKVMIRDKIGGFVSANNCEEYLLNWLHDYRSASTANMGAETKARYPLSDAKVEVKEKPNQPGSYYCIMHLKPHYQLDDIQSHLKLITNVKLS